MDFEEVVALAKALTDRSTSEASPPRFLACLCAEHCHITIDLPGARRQCRGGDTIGCPLARKIWLSGIEIPRVGAPRYFCS